MMAPKNVKFEHFFVQTLHSKIHISHKNGSIGPLFVTPPRSEIGKKIGKMLKYTPNFQSAFGTADHSDRKR